MKRFLRWLKPNTLLGGVVFGLLFGFVALESLLFTFGFQDGVFKSLHLHLLISTLYMIPWVMLWGSSGAVCDAIRGHPGTLATSGAIAFGVGYSFWEGPQHLHPWLLFTISFYTFLAVIPCHLLGYLIARMFGRIHDPEEAE